MTLWFTADTHFGHKNILKYCSRPYRNVTEMDEHLISQWNYRVRPGDVVWHLGDFAFYNAERAVEIVMQLNGTKHLVEGNHDRKLLKSAYFREHWASVHDRTEIVLGHQQVVLDHYPLADWDGKFHGSYMLHGHSHSTVSSRGMRRLDVGVDNVQDFKPIAASTVCAELSAIKSPRADSHRD